MRGAHGRYAGLSLVDRVIEGQHGWGGNSVWVVWHQCGCARRGSGGGGQGGGRGGGSGMGQCVGGGALLSAGSVGGAVACAGGPADVGSVCGTGQCGRTYDEDFAGDWGDGGSGAPAGDVGEEGG